MLNAPACGGDARVELYTYTYICIIYIRVCVCMYVGMYVYIYRVYPTDLFLFALLPGGTDHTADHRRGVLPRGWDPDALRVTGPTRQRAVALVNRGWTRQICLLG